VVAPPFGPGDHRAGVKEIPVKRRENERETGRKRERRRKKNEIFLTRKTFIFFFLFLQHPHWASRATPRPIGGLSARGAICTPCLCYLHPLWFYLFFIVYLFYQLYLTQFIFLAHLNSVI
jgi:hypothetical protein